jgi:hypothetical protein
MRRRQVDGGPDSDGAAAPDASAAGAVLAGVDGTPRAAEAAADAAVPSDMKAMAEKAAAAAAAAAALHDKEPREKELGTAFDCNICFDTPNDPVVTACGHLYCWSCLYRWMRLHAEAPQCPVCKASVERQKVTPIYGRGRSSSGDPRLASTVPSGGAGAVGSDAAAAAAGDSLPPRPAGQRDAAAPPLAAQPFGFHPAVFGRMNAYGNYGSLSLNTFSLFPSLFGMHIAYPHVNEPARDAPNLSIEQETQEQVARVFLFLTFFVILVITWFVRCFFCSHALRDGHPSCPTARCTLFVFSSFM